MNVTFYNPPVWYYSPSNRVTLPALSLPILAAVLNRNGHNARVIDMEAARRYPKNIEEPFPDVIGMTTLTSNKRGVQEMINWLRKHGYTGKIALGGIYATMFPEEVLSWGADLVITGECEGNVIDLLEHAKGIKKGRGLQIEDIPAPDWVHHTPDTHKYTGNVSLFKSSVGITMWTRGCPYRCIFCENLIYNGRKTRYRPPKNIADEMRTLYDRGHKQIFIYDDELVGTKMPDGWMKEIADRIEGMAFSMITQGRCSKRYITHDMMKDVKRAGIDTIFWGIESLSQRVLDAIGKHLTIEDVWHTLNVAKSAKIRNGLYVQVGNYTEDLDDVRITGTALKKLHDAGLVDYLNVFVTGVMPGTELWDIATREGWCPKSPEGRNSMKAAGDYHTPWLTNEDIRFWKTEYRRVCPTPPL